MKNKKPLLVPELREMLATGDSKALQDFCESEPSAIRTERIFTLSGKAFRTLIQYSYTPCRIALERPGCPVDRNRFWSRTSLDRRVGP